MNIFKDLNKFGFEYNKDINIYEMEEIKMKKKEALNSEKGKSVKELLYTKTVTCPVCNTTFKAISVKSSSYKVDSRDSDLFIRYSKVNPYLYDPWVCEHCGYAAMKTDFLKIKDYEIDLIKNNISSKWHHKPYPDEYTVEIAIERYKLCLLNAIESESKSSKKAMICLKLAWMYRLLNGDDSSEKELFFMDQALKGLEFAYTNEGLPIYGMDVFTLTYLLGELNRRLGKYEEALSWFSKVIVSPSVKPSLKELARTQKDICKAEQKEKQS